MKNVMRFCEIGSELGIRTNVLRQKKYNVGNKVIRSHIRLGNVITLNGGNMRLQLRFI